MIPNNQLSSVPHASVFIGSRSTPPLVPLIDRETINVPISQFVYEAENWLGVSDGSSVTISSEGEDDQIIVTDTDITEFSFTFDQNKRPIASYVAGGVAKLKWYDITVNDNVTTSLGSDVLTPRVSLDDKHRLASATNDVILAYIRNDNLCFRQQRDRYQTEYILTAVDSNVRLRRIGMNAVNRFQFECYKSYS